MTSTAQPAPQRHLVMVWNPSYTDDAIDEHLKVLLDFANQFQEHKALQDQVYVWWGKVRSGNRQQGLAHLDDVRALATDLAGANAPEVHLYLTDYRSLYVAEIAEIRFGDLPVFESAHVPPYYAGASLACDFWCKLMDIRRLALNNTLAVIEELKRLRNVHYNEQPVSLYGGMVDLPLMVVRPDDHHFFGDVERESLTGDQLWAEHDYERGDPRGALERDLRDNLIGESAWRGLELTARDAILSGEELFRGRRDLPAFDFAPVITNFSKALECQVNATLRRLLHRVPARARSVTLDGQPAKPLGQASLSLNHLVQVLSKQPQLGAAMIELLHDGAWFTGAFAAFLDRFRVVRNKGTHVARIDRAVATRWRNELMGVGCEGQFARLAKVTLK